MFPRRCASHRNTSVSSAPKPTEYTLPSGPKSPPVSSFGPDIAASSSPWLSPLPETTVLKMPAAAKFQPKCTPIVSHRLRVAAYAAASMKPASTAMATAPHRVASSLSRCESPNTTPVSPSAR